MLGVGIGGVEPYLALATRLLLFERLVLGDTKTDSRQVDLVLHDSALLLPQRCQGLIPRHGMGLCFCLSYPLVEVFGQVFDAPVLFLLSS